MVPHVFLALLSLQEVFDLIPLLLLSFLLDFDLGFVSALGARHAP